MRTRARHRCQLVQFFSALCGEASDARSHERDDPRAKVWAFYASEDKAEGDPKVADDFGEGGEDVGGDDIAEEDGLADGRGETSFEGSGVSHR